MSTATGGPGPVNASGSSRHPVAVEMSSGVAVPQLHRAEIAVAPHGFRSWPDRIVVDGDPGRWIVEQLEIGEAVLAQEGAYSSIDDVNRRMGSLVPRDGVDPDAKISLTVMYVGPIAEGEEFRATLWVAVSSRTVDDAPIAP